MWPLCLYQESLGLLYFLSNVLIEMQIKIIKRREKDKKRKERIIYLISQLQAKVD